MIGPGGELPGMNIGPATGPGGLNTNGPNGFPFGNPKKGGRGLLATSPSLTHPHEL